MKKKNIFNKGEIAVENLKKPSSVHIEFFGGHWIKL
jgi:hypothetical protein